jgi:hypothetical protein
MKLLHYLHYKLSKIMNPNEYQACKSDIFRSPRYKTYFLLAKCELPDSVNLHKKYFGMGTCILCLEATNQNHVTSWQSFC